MIFRISALSRGCLLAWDSPLYGYARQNSHRKMQRCIVLLLESIASPNLFLLTSMPLKDSGFRLFPVSPLIYCPFYPQKLGECVS